MKTRNIQTKMWEETLSKIPLNILLEHVKRRKENITDFYRSEGP